MRWLWVMVSLGLVGCPSVERFEGTEDTTVEDSTTGEDTAVGVDTSDPDTSTEQDTGGTDTQVADTTLEDTGSVDTQPGDTAPDEDVAAPEAITASVSASRITGVAPLAVVFDASGTTVLEPVEDPPHLFHKLAYRWDFGDPGSGTWENTSKMSRNEELGPVAGHVFETPGTYTVTLTVRSMAGDQDVETVEITVEDPDVVFSGATLCFTLDGDFAEAPSSCNETLTVADLAEALGYVGPGRRLLFKRGETWSLTEPIAIESTGGPVRIATFGSSTAKTQWSASSFGIVLLADSDGEVDDLVLQDIDMVSTTNNEFLGSFGTVNRVTLLRLDITSNDIALRLENENLALPPRGVSVVDCLLDGVNGGAQLDGEEMLFLGNRVPDREPGLVSFGTNLMDTVVFAHNVVGGEYFDLFAPQYDEIGPTFQRKTEKVVFSHNRFVDLVVVGAMWGPEGSGVDQRISDIIFEANFFEGVQDDVSILSLSGSRYTLRNNIIASGKTDGLRCIELNQRRDEPPPSDIWIYNNTCYSNTSERLTLLIINPLTERVHVANNIYRGERPFGDIIEDESGSAVLENNLDADGLVFVEASPVKPTDFAPTAGALGTAVDTGTDVPVLSDFSGKSRPQNGTWDIGAIEHAP